MRRAALGLGGLGTLVFLAAWLSLPDKTLVFDGVMFAGVIERRTVDWAGELWNPRHLLFNPALQLLRDALLRLGVAVEAYRLIQIVNAFLGAAGLWLFGLLLRDLTDDELFSACGAALLGATWAYGTRATEGQVYMALAAGGLWTLRQAVRLRRAPTTANALRLAGAFAVTVLFHAAAVALAPAVAAALWLAFPGRRRVAAGAVLFGAALIAAPYLLRFRHLGFQGFLGGAVDYRTVDADGYWIGLVRKFWHNGGIGPGRRLAIALEEAGLGLAALPAAAGVVLGLALWAGAALAGWTARSAAVIVLGLAWAGTALLNAFWNGGLFFAVLPTASLLAIVAAAVPEGVRRRAPGALASAALVLAAWNVHRGLKPQSSLESNASYRKALFIRAHVVPTSYVIITGVADSNLKVYIPNFANRSRDVLEYYFYGRTKERALALLRHFASAEAEQGVPLYILSEVLEDAKAQETMRRLWGVEPEDIQAAFGAGKLVGIARGPDVSVYLFVPQARQAELFVGLGYSVLVEDDLARLQESVAALKEIAREMTPAERRRVAALMRSSEWGFEMMRKGFAPVMNDAMRAEIEGRRARFAAYRGTGDFWLRVGNLCRIAGLKDETIAAWTEAYKLSKDAQLARDIEAFRKLP